MINSITSHVKSIFMKQQSDQPTRHKLIINSYRNYADPKKNQSDFKGTFL